MMRNTYSVSQVNSYVRNMFTQDFFLRDISVKGEVSNCKYHSSGHIYFTLKDGKAAISAVMFAGDRRNLNFRMEEGDQVIVAGSVDVYERDGRYQLYAKKITQDGAGDLFLRYEALKNELQEMGMFAEEYKKSIPKYIRTLGVVTASTGAAIQDIRNIAGRRNPFVQVILYPAKVQGEGAAESIVNGIAALEQYGVDTMIVGRGGGSIEDLWAFNEEIVARAIFECSVPIISAVGHETDVTIADFVADLRAPTPSAAAELAVYDIREYQENIERYKKQMTFGLEHKLHLMENRYQMLFRKLERYHPMQQLRARQQTLISYEEKLQHLMMTILEKRKYQLGIYAQRMDGVSPAKKLSQGLAFVSNEQGQRISSIKDVTVAQDIEVHLKDGVLSAKVSSICGVKRPEESDRR